MRLISTSKAEIVRLDKQQKKEDSYTAYEQRILNVKRKGENIKLCLRHQRKTSIFDWNQKKKKKKTFVSVGHSNQSR